MQEIFYYNSPIGILKGIIENNALLSLTLSEEAQKTPTQSELPSKIQTQLDGYFNGNLQKFDIPLKLSGTEFQKTVWSELLKIPYGQTKSYKEIAQAIGKPSAMRAVGGACNKNKILVVIPCHRVIAKNGNLQGFACGVAVKKELLKLEKTFEDNLLYN